MHSSIESSGNFQTAGIGVATDSDRKIGKRYRGMQFTEMSINGIQIYEKTLDHKCKSRKSN